MTGQKFSHYDIISRHKKLSDAVDAAGLDKSYNEYEANRKIRLFENRGIAKEAYVISANIEDISAPKRVFMLTNNGHLSELDLFESWLDDSGLDLATIGKDHISIAHVNIPNNNESRELAAGMGWTTTKIDGLSLTATSKPSSC